MDDYTPSMLFGKKTNTQRIYMDYASTTPLDAKVFKIMEKILEKNFHNPSSLYNEGVESKKILEGAREKVARTIKARTEEIFFTGSGTEADNIAVRGIFNYFKKERSSEKIHIVTSTIEHPAIIETCRQIEKEGGMVTYVAPEEDGVVSVEKIIQSLTPDTVLVSLMLVNNEIGTIQPIRELSRALQVWKKDLGIGTTVAPFLHTDASQAPVYYSVGVEKLGADLITLDGSKIYGPKGVGCLFKKHYVPCEPIIFGGGQEFGLRAGTENLPQIVGFAEAFAMAQNDFVKESESATLLREYFFEQLLELSEKISRKIEINGSREKRIANNISICISDLDAEFAVIQLNEKGIACASMTACRNLDDNSSSYVIESLGKKECATSTLRFTLGKSTTKKEIDKVISAIQSILSK